MKSLLRSLALTALVLALAAPVFAQGQMPNNPPSNTGTMKSNTTKRHTGTRMHSRKMMENKIDLNTATADELMKLPGVDQAMADKIIAGRPYASKRQLESKHILTKTEYNKISTRVWAKQEKESKATEMKEEKSQRK